MLLIFKILINNKKLIVFNFMIKVNLKIYI